MTEILHSLLYMLGEMAPYILLGFLIAGLLHAFIPSDTFARHLSGRGWKSVVKAAAIGIPLPLCSCGVLPTAIAMRRAGASRAATTSFLIATPQTGVDSIAATWSLLGPAFAIIRPIAALVTAFFGGIAVGAGEKDAPKDSAVKAEDVCLDGDCATRRSFFGKLVDALRYGFVDLAGSIGLWLIAGLIIAALITVFVPADAFAALGSRPLLAMLAVVVVAVPMYVCATGSIPIALSLMLKGLSPGTALVLLMAGPAANFASFALISREMGRRAALTYVGVIVAGAMLFGLGVDYLLPASWFSVAAEGAAEHCHHLALTPLQWVSSAILLILLAVGLFRSYVLHKNHHHIDNEMEQKFDITGMNCPHCQAAVRRAIESVEGVESAEVSLTEKSATVAGTADPAAIVAAVHAAGFEASPR